MGSLKKFEDIQSWQRARELTKGIYAFSDNDAFARDYGLRDQIRRASGSIMHNIAEGFDAGSDAEFIRFLRYARRSATEVLSQLYIAFDRQYISKNQFVFSTKRSLRLNR